MKRFTLLLFGLLGFLATLDLASSPGYGAELRPYIARITTGEARVHSAPDRDAYVTSTLRRGDKVEIYLEVDDWCAIRPPGGSFSWVGAQYVNQGENSVGTVIVDGLASRIGSELGDFGSTVQVKLRKGEKVLILDRVETPENRQSPGWFKIAPPSGEYRWVHRDSLKAQPEPAKERPEIVQTPRRLTKPETTPIRQVVYESEPAPASETRSAAPARSRQPTTASRSAAAATEDRDLEEIRRSVSLPTGVSGDNQAFPPVASRVRATVPERRPSDPFQKTYEELKAATLSILTRQADDEEFEILIDRAERLYEEAPEWDLEKVFHLVETLQRTRLVRQEIAMRRGFKTQPLLPPIRNTALPNPSYTTQYRANPWNSGAPDPRTAGATATRGGSVRVAERAEETSENGVTHYRPLTLHREGTLAVQEDALEIPEELVSFDVVGRLGAFDDVPAKYPPFALVDENTEIVCLLTPAEGVDLEPFVGDMVGLHGRHEYYRVAGKKDKKHLTVLNVTRLEESEE